MWLEVDIILACPKTHIFFPSYNGKFSGGTTVRQVKCSIKYVEHMHRYIGHNHSGDDTPWNERVSAFTHSSSAVHTYFTYLDLYMSR